MIPKSIEDIVSVYQLGYYTLNMHGGEPKYSLVAAVESVIKHASEKKKVELLGEKGYSDYVFYQDKMQKKEYSNFVDVLEYFFPSELYGQINQLGILEELLEEKTLNPVTLIAAGITKKNFSLEYFNLFIKEVDEVRKQKN